MYKIRLKLFSYFLGLTSGIGFLVILTILYMNFEKALQAYRARKMLFSYLKAFKKTTEGMTGYDRQPTKN